jgi:hypothetical protein
METRNVFAQGCKYNWGKILQGKRLLLRYSSPSQLFADRPGDIMVVWHRVFWYRTILFPPYLLVDLGQEPVRIVLVTLEFSIVVSLMVCAQRTRGP